MVLHPEIQKKAQAEIDAVVGHDRLPDFNDRPSLPYIDRIVQETLRYVHLLARFVSHLTSVGGVQSRLLVSHISLSKTMSTTECSFLKVHLSTPTRSL